MVAHVVGRLQTISDLRRDLCWSLDTVYRLIVIAGRKA